MVRRCCVTACRGNYINTEKVKVFRLPKDQDERKRWLKSIPRDNIPDHPDTVVCEKHFPPGYATVNVFGKERPKEPPSVFDNLPLSLLPSPAPKPRTTKRTSASERNIQNDEMAEFLKKDIFGSFENLCSTIDEHDFVQAIEWKRKKDSLMIESDKVYCGACPLFVIKIFPTLKYECYHANILTVIPSLMKNDIRHFQRWSQIEEALRELSQLPINRFKTVIKEQTKVMSTQVIGQRVYDPEILVRAFQHFVTSRASYKMMRGNLKLPSEKTLTRLTSKVCKLEDLQFLSKIFSTLEENKKKMHHYS